MTKFILKTNIYNKRLVSKLQKQFLFYKSLRKRQTAQLEKEQKTWAVVNRWENISNQKDMQLQEMQSNQENAS